MPEEKKPKDTCFHGKDNHKEEKIEWTALEIYNALDIEEYDEESNRSTISILNDTPFITKSAYDKLKEENEKLREIIAEGVNTQFYEKISELQKEIEKLKKYPMDERWKEAEAEIVKLKEKNKILKQGYSKSMGMEVQSLRDRLEKINDIIKKYEHPNHINGLAEEIKKVLE